MRHGYRDKCTVCVLATLVLFGYFFVLYVCDTKNSTMALKAESSRKDLIYILQWTSPLTEPFVFMGVGQDGFIRRNCTYTNCYVTSNRELLDDLTKYDALLFHGPEIMKNIPSISNHDRLPSQKYIFASMESSQYYPICSDDADGFFNWTWTYRLDSDARWGYIIVTDKNNVTLGPNKIMHWIKQENFDPVPEHVKNKLKSKSLAAAWFVSNCDDKSGRKRFVDQLKVELRKFNLRLDIFGKCGTHSCSRNHEDCDKMIEEKYYFYLAFENSFSEDYVTEKLLRALAYNAVPIVYGGANYTRFMPDGIYLNARTLGVVKLAEKMNELIQNQTMYAEYFRWKSHYSYYSREGDLFNEYCNFCALLNNKKKMKEVTVIHNFRKWWNDPDYCYKTVY